MILFRFSIFIVLYLLVYCFTYVWENYDQKAFAILGDRDTFSGPNEGVDVSVGLESLSSFGFGFGFFALQEFCPYFSNSNIGI